MTIDRPPGDIRSVLIHYGFDDTLPDVGGWKTVRCAFHGDRRASGRVSIADGAYFCNACDAKGDVFSLVMWKERCDFRDAVRRYEEITGESVTPVRQSAKRSGPRVPHGGKTDYERSAGGFQSRLYRQQSRRRRPGSPD